MIRALLLAALAFGGLAYLLSRKQYVEACKCGCHSGTLQRNGPFCAVWNCACRCHHAAHPAYPEPGGGFG